MQCGIIQVKPKCGFLEHKGRFYILGSKFLLQIQNGRFSFVPIIPLKNELLYIILLCRRLVIKIS